MAGILSSMEHKVSGLDVAAMEIRQWKTIQDGLDNVFMVTAPMPKPGRNEALVEIHTVCLNYRDPEVCMGLYNHHKSLPSEAISLVPCSDMCGTIIEVGEGCSTWKVGDRVLSVSIQTFLSGQIRSHHLAHGLGFPLDGVMQTHRVFPSTGLVKAPDYLTDEEACTLPVACITAWMCINGMRAFDQPGGKGEVVLLQGTGGVSIAGLQIAQASGSTTIITSSSDDKLQRAKALGATHTINWLTNPEWQDEVLRLTDGVGADIIFENCGAKTTRKSFECVAWGGLISSIGCLSGKENDLSDRTNINALAIVKNVTIKGILNGPKDRLEQVLAFYAEHRIHPVVDRIFTFEEAKEAIKYLFAASHFGKIVVKVKA